MNESNYNVGDLLEKMAKVENGAHLTLKPELNTVLEIKELYSEEPWDIVRNITIENSVKQVAIDRTILSRELTNLSLLSFSDSHISIRNSSGKPCLMAIKAIVRSIN